MSLPIFPTLPGFTYTCVKTPSFNTLDMVSPNGYEVRIQQTINPLWTFTLIYDFLHDFFWGGFTIVSELRTLMGFFNQMGGKAGSFLYTDPGDYNVGPALTTAAWLANNSYPVGYGILDTSNHWQKVTAVTTGISGGTIPPFSTTGGSVVDGGVTWTDQGAYTSSGIPNEYLAGLSLVTDGTNWYSPIQRTLNGVFYEDITDLNGSIAVYANGTLATAGTGAGQYTVAGPGLALPGTSYMGLYLQWGTGSPPTGPITAQFDFYFRVKFDSDAQDFEKFLGTGTSAANQIAGQGDGYFTIGGSEAQQGTGTLKLSTARPVPL